MKRRLIPCFLFLLGSASASDAWYSDSFDPNTTQNRTIRDESHGRIQSIYPDIRGDLVGVRSGYPMGEWDGCLTLGVDGYSVIRRVSDFDIANQKTAPTDGPIEHRRMANLLFRFALPYSIGLEIEESAGHVDYGSTDQWTWGDPATRLLVPLWSSRYSGGTLTAGARQPIGNEDDWSQAHGSWTILLGLRAIMGFDQFVFGFDGEAGYCPWGRNSVGSATYKNQLIDNIYSEVHGAAFLTYRIASWVRFGVSQKCDYRAWRGQLDYKDVVGDFSVYQAPTVGVIEVNLANWCRLQAYGGADWLTNRDGAGGPETITAGGSLVMTW